MRAEVLPPPEVADGLPTCDPQIGPAHGDPAFLAPEVEEPNRHRAVFATHSSLNIAKPWLCFPIGSLQDKANHHFKIIVILRYLHGKGF